MTHMEEAKLLREDPNVHYNCAQSVLIPFREACGLSREAANQLGANFGSGMRHGGACGALTGALMVLGLAGKEASAANELMRRFRTENNDVNCSDLLRQAQERGEPRKAHCDRMVYQAIALLEELMGEKEEN